MGQFDSRSVMTRARPSIEEPRASEVRLDRLLGRQVLAVNNRPVGRLEEFRVEKRGTGSVVTEYVIGVAGLAERLGLGIGLVLGRTRGGFVARWDQLDLRDPEHPRLTCPLEQLSMLD
jgi:hypothetical protein